MGSIQKLKDRPNRPYRARYWNNGKQESKSFSKRGEAEIWLRNQETDHDRGVWRDPKAGSTTLSQWSESWLRGLTGLKPKTIAGYESLLRSRVLPQFGTHQLNQITPAEVRSWIADMGAEGKSPATITQNRQVLHAMLEQAVGDDLIPRNPTAHVKTPSVKPRRQLFLTAQQVSLLATAAEARQSGAGLFVRFLAYSGLRWGEAVALRRNSFGDHGRVRISESATEVGGKLIWGTPKTHETRLVILPRFLSERLANHVEGLAGDDLVFTALRGGPLRVSNFRRSVWTPACEASGVPEGLLIHDLRDTAASLAISSDASVLAVTRMLGHKSAKMTLDTYASLFDSDLEELAEKMDKKFAAADAEDGDSDGKVANLPRQADLSV